MTVVRHDIEAFILAGGKSSRMGMDKGTMDFNGIAMVDRVIRVCKSVFSCATVVANSAQYFQYGLPVIKDVIPNLGPVGGIYTSLLHSTSEWIFVVSCDMPFVWKGPPMLHLN